MTIPEDVAACLNGYLERCAPGRVVQFGPEGTLPSAWAERGYIQRLIQPDLDLDQDLAGCDQFDLALVLDAPKILSTIATRQLLARLRNYSAGAILTAFDIDSARQSECWSVAEFLGLGFRRVSEARQLNSHYWIYRYDIYDYKITPDWLNSRHWANPEQWDRRRW
ncbi:DUF6231 family protein [Salinisphaera sp. SPP-AMP-43]|uniref:DUF6231 family protein n=1 Tax=Salinisphaera sp. SPP-AMP-43 TaxID=3121288 RepID=UPI003C6E6688